VAGAFGRPHCRLRAAAHRVVSWHPFRMPRPGVRSSRPRSPAGPGRRCRC
jgi:hypothetical protein